MAARTVYVILHTRDMDELDLSVHATVRSAVTAARRVLEPDDTDEAGTPAKEALKTWDGSSELEIWEAEGRVAMTLMPRKVQG